MGFTSKTSFFLLFSGILLLNALEEVSSAAARGGCACSLKYYASVPGCIIAEPPAFSGFKCRCRVGMLFFMIPHCVGTALPCDAGETCPAGCASRECCLRGQGDCKGYDGVNSLTFKK